jgi:hypothetical protein
MEEENSDAKTLAFRLARRRDISMWQPISSAPKDRHIDIVAKKWDPKTDLFQVKRFSDCYWFIPPQPNYRVAERWVDIDADWRPFGWMEPPDLPLPEELETS